MKTFKVVSVYSGYGEMSINSVSNTKGRSIDDVCNGIMEDNRNMLIESYEGKDEWAIAHWYEFYNYKNVNFNEGFASVGNGEEDFYFVFDNTNEWYKEVDENDDWSLEM